MDFTCIHCGQKISLSAPGTQHRNHCPYCLYSLHLDKEIPGDRQAACGGAMEPVGLAYKDEGGNKVGELCLIHHCTKCSAGSKNRLAADDDTKAVLAVLKKSGENIDRLEVYTQLFGKSKAQEMLKLQSANN